MNLSKLQIILIILGSLFLLTIIIFIILYSTTKINIIPHNPNHHHKYHLIGGCKGTQYGCCPDGITARGGPNVLC